MIGGAGEGGELLPVNGGTGEGGKLLAVNGGAGEGGELLAVDGSIRRFVHIEEIASQHGLHLGLVAARCFPHHGDEERG
jgi:hypothetical protein